MDATDTKKLAQLISHYNIIDVIDTLQEVIEDQIDELVDTNYGHTDLVKEMTLVAHHLSILPRKGII